MRKRLSANAALGTLFSGVLAGMMIAIGGTVFLSIENRVIGASFFTVGLFTVVSLRLWLYTGRIGWALERGSRYAVQLVLTLVGNFFGTLTVGLLLRQTRIAAPLVTRAAALSADKMGDSLSSLFILAIFCGILMYLAVRGFQTFEHALGRYAAVFFGVTVFILAGFEHCIANMYYYTLAGVWLSARAWGTLAVMIAGNSVGSILMAQGCRLSENLLEEVTPKQK